MPTQISNLYHLKQGKPYDKARLIKYMELTYTELFPEQSQFSHLQTTVEQYLSTQTPIWWIEYQSQTPQVVAGLWMGTAIDQVSGHSYGHIFLIYVMPAHRRQGLATRLIKEGQKWAKNRGYHQIGLQVFERNQQALKLYDKLGFRNQSYLMLQTFG